MKTLNRLRKLFLGKATTSDKLSLLWSFLAFIVSNLLVVGSMFIALLAVIVIFTGSASSTEYESSGGGQSLPESVTRWKPDVTKLAKENGVEDHVDILLGIIMVESRGEGLDIMQSSESAGMGPNGFDDPMDSLKQGIKYFAKNVELAKKNDADIWSAVQAYNFGSGYISYVGKNGGTHTTSIAEDFSKKVVAPQLGNSAGRTYTYINAVSQADGRTYLYLNGGNFHYVGLVKQYLPSNNGNIGNGKYRIPFDGEPNITSGFVIRISPITGEVEQHLGQDFAQPVGTKILASMGGKVVISEFHNSYGNYVVIEHSNGTWTAYAHHSKLLVKVGDVVSQGDPVGIIGTTGDSTGIHSHFEIRRSLFGDHEDPAPHLGLN